MFCDKRLKKYYFETGDPVLADAFLNLLPVFDITTEDIYISSKYWDYSEIEFRTTRDVRLRLEYTFRRSVHLYPKYLMDVDYRESSLELTCEDKYVIY